MSTRGVDPERPRCPACGQTTVTAGKITCPTCWARVPRSYRHAVALCHQAWAGDPTDQNWAAYMRTRRDALNTLLVDL